METKKNINVMKRFWIPLYNKSQLRKQHIKNIKFKLSNSHNLYNLYATQRKYTKKAVCIWSLYIQLSLQGIQILKENLKSEKPCTLIQYDYGTVAKLSYIFWNLAVSIAGSCQKLGSDYNLYNIIIVTKKNEIITDQFEFNSVTLRVQYGSINTWHCTTCYWQIN